MTPLPSDRTAAAFRASRRALVTALVSGALGAALALVAAGQTWAEGVASLGSGTLEVSVSGSDVTGLPSALALVGLAAMVAVFAVRRRTRHLVAALLALSGAGTLAASLAGAANTSALREEAAEATGLTGSGVAQVTHSAWPWVAAFGGLLLLAAGALALRYGRGWPAMGGRYERPGVPVRRPARPADPERPEEMWKALDRGEDPTRADATGPDAAGAGPTGPDATGPGSPGERDASGESEADGGGRGPA